MNPHSTSVSSSGANRGFPGILLGFVATCLFLGNPTLHASFTWNSFGAQYDNGSGPSVSYSSNNNCLVEVHKGGTDGTIWSRTAHLVSDSSGTRSLFWRRGSPSSVNGIIFGAGADGYVSAAVGSQSSRVVAVDWQIPEKAGGFSLHYFVGQIDDAGDVQWQQEGPLNNPSSQLQKGGYPSVWVSADGSTVVMVFVGSAGDIRYQTGTLFFSQPGGIPAIAWTKDAPINSETGSFTSVTAVSPALIVEAHQQSASSTFGALRYTIGSRNSDGSVSWSPTQTYDHGVHPSIAWDGKEFVEAHQGGVGFTPLWYNLANLPGPATPAGTLSWVNYGVYDHGVYPCIAGGPFVGAYNIMEVHQGSVQPTSGSDVPLWNHVATSR